MWANIQAWLVKQIHTLPIINFFLTADSFFEDIRAILVGATGGLLIWALTLIRGAFRESIKKDAIHDDRLTRLEVKVDFIIAQMMKGNPSETLDRVLSNPHGDNTL